MHGRCEACESFIVQYSKNYEINLVWIFENEKSKFKLWIVIKNVRFVFFSLLLIGFQLTFSFQTPHGKGLGSQITIKIGATPQFQNVYQQTARGILAKWECCCCLPVGASEIHHEAACCQAYILSAHNPTSLQHSWPAICSRLFAQKVQGVNRALKHEAGRGGAAASAAALHNLLSERADRPEDR